MSSKKLARHRAGTAAPAKPLIGSLLRLPREYIVHRMFAELERNGFGLSESEMAVFMYPGPDGRRPIELARQCNSTRQAMNYVLTGLERRGFIVRRGDDGERPKGSVEVTERGWEVYERMRSTVMTIEAEWRLLLGAQRFDTLKDTLQELSQWVAEQKGAPGPAMTAAAEQDERAETGSVGSNSKKAIHTKA